ncbi:hypothetical protein SAMN05444267_105616 [Chryseobacterium polytrichastri]|uniref:Uncharacterized protein n=1 Tax=Chryseobacterium polytrichastri TaxID=1302687 RepID=A0A1M7K2P0_9FLAO|nr:hypothetical protein SAMN05444267_105616 [Chryseobacterium polytrichastri]
MLGLRCNSISFYICLEYFTYGCECKYDERTQIYISLKNHSDVPILNDDDKYKCLIYNIYNYYFIKENVKIIYSYLLSTGEITSFTVK